MSKSEAVLAKSCNRNIGLSIIAGEVRSCPPIPTGSGDQTLEEFDTNNYITCSTNPYRPLTERCSKATVDVSTNDASRQSRVGVAEDSCNSWRNSILFRLFSCCSNSTPPPSTDCSDDILIPAIVMLTNDKSVRITHTLTHRNDTPLEATEETTTNPRLLVLPEVHTESLPVKSANPSQANNK